MARQPDVAVVPLSIESTSAMRPSEDARTGKDGVAHMFLVGTKGSSTHKWISQTEVHLVVLLPDASLYCFAQDRSSLSQAGVFGPIGIEKSHRGHGTGKSLILACMLDMKLRRYGYAVIGSTSIFLVYKKAAGGVEIPDSSPGLWRIWLGRDTLSSSCWPVPPHHNAAPTIDGRGGSSVPLWGASYDVVSSPSGVAGGWMKSSRAFSTRACTLYSATSA